LKIPETIFTLIVSNKEEVFMNDNENEYQDFSGEVTPASGGEMSLIAKIVGVFLDPKRTFTSLDRKPDFWAPLIIIVALSLVFTTLAWPIIEESSLEMRRGALEKTDMSQGEIDRALEIQMKAGKIPGIVSIVISTLVIAFIVAGALLFAGNVIMGGESSYKKMMSVYCYSSLIGLISTAIRLPMILSKKTLEIYFSPAAFFPAEMKDALAFKIAAIFDIFVIWKIILIAIGMGIVYKTKTEKPLIVVGVMYLLVSGVSILISNLSMSFGG